MKKGSVIAVIMILVISMVATGCGSKSSDKIFTDPKIEAPIDVLEAAQDVVSGYENYLNNRMVDGKYAKIKTEAAEITNLQLACSIDIYHRQIGNRVVKGIETATFDFYAFSFKVKPAEGVEDKAFEKYTDKKGYIVCDEGMPGQDITVLNQEDAKKEEAHLYLSFINRDGKSSCVGTVKAYGHIADLSDSDVVWERYIDIYSPDKKAEATETAANIEKNPTKYNVKEDFTFSYHGGGEGTASHIMKLGFFNQNLPEKYGKLLGKGGKKTKLSDVGWGDYMVSYKYDGGSLNLNTVNFGMPKEKGHLEELIYIGTDDSAWKTYRGIGVSNTETELIFAYPSDLCYVQKSILDAGVHEKSSAIKDLDYGYSYQGEEAGSRDIFFGIKDGKIVFMDMSANYEYKRYDKAFGDSKPIVEPTNEKSGLNMEGTEKRVKVEVAYADVLAPDFEGSYEALIDIDVPRATESTVNHEAINKIIERIDSYPRELVQIIQSGSQSALYSYICENQIYSYSFNYDVNICGTVAALVITEEQGYPMAGTYHGQQVLYYDCETGRLIDRKQYAEKCGFTEAGAMKDIKATAEYESLAEQGIIAGDNIHQFDFYIDKNKKLHLLISYSM